MCTFSDRRGVWYKSAMTALPTYKPSQARLRSAFDYDAATGRLCHAATGIPAPIVATKGYLQVSFDGLTMRHARVVWIWHYGDIPDGYDIDHADSNPRNDRIENLRPILPDDNMRRSNANWGKVPYRGVSKMKNGKYRTKINFFNKGYQLGVYNSAALAASAYEHSRMVLMQDVYTAPPYFDELPAPPPDLFQCTGWLKLIKRLKDGCVDGP